VPHPRRTNPEASRLKPPLACPTWTADGRVVFSFGYVLLSPQQLRLVSVKADGTDWEELTSGTEFSDFEPEVSPNGQRIALRRASPG
jgi:hypothetical protein